MKEITVIDYGMGNLGSVKKAFEYLGYRVVLTSDAAEILKAESLVLPGVGAFKEAMGRLKLNGKIDALKKKILIEKVPFLGICLGMQLLFEFSEEGSEKGLGILKGDVKLIPKKQGLKIPHMGWNRIKVKKNSPILKNLDGEYFYFVHSYFADAEMEDVSSVTEYGGEITASVEKGNIFATQFHPEKSGKAGLQLLENFGRLL
ncbi:imidazole glycerol phosphate synthase subunit HisH [Thermovenabulum sp.]|uniref:imidazole glycerol phosphate synthase subunit HisH n=1 Tax=Thermovenabulum sp. TaxID=3100335 RepID=UPI003C7AD549